MHKLAILGGAPVIQNPIQSFSTIGEAEKTAVIKFFEESKTLSGFFGSARPEFSGGPEVRAFEEEWCLRFDVTHAVSVNSATSGLMVAMGAIGISPGDEVIVPPFTMSATAIAPLIYGGIPVFADVEENYFCIDPKMVENLITSKTKAIIATNLFGHPADLHLLRKIADKHKIFLIEDNAQAVLAEDQNDLAGTIGHIGIYSLNVHKHIQTGEGGVCVTENSELAERMQLIRNHGENVVEWKNISDLTNLVGYNFRMLELTAVIGKEQLKRIDALVKRTELFGIGLTEGLKNLEGITAPKVRNGCRHNYFMWPCLYDEKKLGVSRELFVKAVKAEGVPMEQGYVKPLYLLPLFQKRIAIGHEGFPFTLTDRQYSMGLCPVAESLHFKKILHIQPVAWSLDKEQMDLLIAAIHKVHKNIQELKALETYA